MKVSTKTLALVAGAAMHLVDAGCTCRGTHDEGRPGCQLNRAWASLVEACDALKREMERTDG